MSDEYGNVANVANRYGVKMEYPVKFGTRNVFMFAGWIPHSAGGITVSVGRLVFLLVFTQIKTIILMLVAG